MAFKGNEEELQASRKEATLILRLPREKVYLFRFLLEASGHLAFLTVRGGGLVELRFDAETAQEVHDFLKGLPLSFEVS